MDELDDIKWSNEPQLLNRLVELDTQGYTQTEMVDHLYGEFGIRTNRDRVKNALAFIRERMRNLYHSPVPQRTPYYDKYKQYIEGDAVLEKNEALFSSVMEKSKRKILVLSDLHVPSTDEEKFQQAIDLHRTADVVVLAGDIMDSYAISRWRKEGNYPFEAELDMTTRLFEYLSKTFPIVYVTPGNHDQRATKRIQDSLPPELLFLFKGSPLEYITKAFSNIKYHDSWFIQIGDAIFGHPERSSVVDGKPAIMLMEYFLNKGWSHRLNLNPTPRVFVCAHTHQMSCMYRENVKVFESGCLAQLMGYAQSSQAVMRPPRNGCVSIVQFDGVSDFNQCREWLL